MLLRTMGYQQEVVERIVKETGQTEDTFLVLEKIVEETKRCKVAANGCEKDRQLKSTPSPDSPTSSSSSSSSSSNTARLREKERELSRVLGDAVKSKENIKPKHHECGSHSVGHQRQCSSSDPCSQQVHPFSKKIIFSSFPFI